MESSRRMIPAILLFLLLIATGMGPTVVEGQNCRSQSRGFRGVCVIDSICENVCQGEGFQNGYCAGFPGRCYCVGPC